MFSASTVNKDNLHYGEEMSAPDREEFEKALVKEVTDLSSSDVWDIIPKSSLPVGARLIRLIWSFK